jgi:hypothetical protein
MNDFSVHSAMHAAVCPAVFVASDKASAASCGGLRLGGPDILFVTRGGPRRGIGGGAPHFATGI